jgi:hypothetical protein
MMVKITVLAAYICLDKLLKVCDIFIYLFIYYTNVNILLILYINTGLPVALVVRRCRSSSMTIFQTFFNPPVHSKRFAAAKFC